ncbi:MAG: primosome assembly protein PriA [Propionibacteriaceae bacterium]|nr:primosome assembly protein PriA [Propionibacteriaceae bacterium]
MDRTIAEVAVDTPLAHLDRRFDYEVPSTMLPGLAPGARVRVRFAGRPRDGYVMAVKGDTDQETLLPVERLVSPEVVLLPEVARLVRAVADHYAGTFADVVRLAVPPRHGKTEQAKPPDFPAVRLEPGRVECLGHYEWGGRFCQVLRDGGRPRAAWCALPVFGADWPAGLLDAAEACLESGRGALVLAPDAGELRRLEAACAARFGKGGFVSLSAEVGPAARYRRFLAVSRGSVKLVLGTRAAVFAPVADLGLIAMWDDGDDSYAEPRAPYPHAREVAALRAHLAGAGLLLGGHVRTAEVEALLEKGWLAPIGLPPSQARLACPRVAATAGRDSYGSQDPAGRVRVPHDAFTLIRAGLAQGPVLVQVPRTGYLQCVACATCQRPARCPRCQEPLRAEAGGLTCRWCGPANWSCPDCGDNRFRAGAVGVRRTAEEFGKAFPGTLVVQSRGDQPVASVPDEPALVLSTPGVEPEAVGGYAAAVLLDADAMLWRPDLRAGEEALRRWLRATALVRPAGEGGTAMIVGSSGERAVQAALRLDPAGFAARELADRREAGFPPAVKLVTVEGPLSEVADAVGQLELPDGVEQLGPFPLPGEDETCRVTLRAVAGGGAALVRAVKLAQSSRSARKLRPLRVRVDPQVVG